MTFPALRKNGPGRSARTPAVCRGGPSAPTPLRHDELVETSVAAVVSYVDRAVDQMAVIVTELGDDLANRKPVLAGSNSPYAILRHCLGVMEFWGGQVVAGRVITRDRDAEFRARGPVTDLTAATADT